MYKSLLNYTSAFVLVAAFSQQGYAACTSTLISSPRVSFSGTIPVQRDAPVGTVIALGQSSMSVNVTQYSGTLFVTQLLGMGEYLSMNYNNARIRKTNLDGVGIAFWSNVDNGIGANLDAVHASRVGQASGTVYYALVKTKPTIQSGILDVKAFDMGYVCLGMTGTIYYGAQVRVTGGAFIQEAACAVLEPVINVPLGTVRRSLFTGIGSTSESVGFSIPLNCKAGTRINISFTPGASGSVAPANGVLALDSAGSSGNAANVGVQLLYNDRPVALNTMLALGETSLEGNITIPMKARYYQTSGAEVTAGTANATATFTMTYR